VSARTSHDTAREIPEATVARLKERIEGIRADRRSKQPPPQAGKPDDPTGELLSRRRRR